jgi:PAS domain-containing protein
MIIPGLRVPNVSYRTQLWRTTFLPGEGRIFEANDAFLRIVGYERDRREWVPVRKATGTLQPFEKEYFRKDGRRVPVLIGVAMFKESEVAWVWACRSAVRLSTRMEDGSQRSRRCLDAPCFRLPCLLTRTTQARMPKLSGAARAGRESLLLNFF